MTSTRLHRLVPCLLIGLATLLGSGAARADDMREFELALNRFEAAEYDEAAKRFAILLDPSKPQCSTASAAGSCRLTDPELIERARGLHVLTLVALKRFAEADQRIMEILLENDAYVPNPAMFPREVIDRFTEVRSKYSAEINAARDKKLKKQRDKLLADEKFRKSEKEYQETIERMAGTETIRQPNSRWLALIPFGVGQFQNGEKGLGWMFLGSEVVAGSLSIMAAAFAYDRASIDPYDTTLTDAEGRSCGEDCRAELLSQRDTWITVNRVAFGAWAALTVAGLVQAQIAFVPERVTYRPRPLPKRPAPPATVSIVPGIGTLTVRGTF